MAACAVVPAAKERRATADALAAAQGWHMTAIPAGAFELAAWLPSHYVAAPDLTIYIEGDGLAWLSPDTPSTDPTPVAPLALKLALAQADGNAVYLARPCQYLANSNCSQRYWTDARFASEVIAAMNDAVDALKRRSSARRLSLVGYSGGAAVAALLAARRSDVVRLVTVAGNLDHRAWTEFHRLTPLTGSLNPADDRAALARIPQWHFVGARDAVVPPALVRAFATGMPAAHVIELPGYDHHCCWAKNWATLWREVR